MTASHVQADQPRDQEDHSPEDEGDDTLVLPARTPWPLMPLRPDSGNDDGNHQPDQGEKLNVHGVNYSRRGGVTLGATAFAWPAWPKLTFRREFA